MSSGGIALVTGDCELDQSIEQLRLWQSARLPQLRIHADRGEARDRVDLVDERRAILLQKEIDARHTLAAGNSECQDGELLQVCHDALGQPRRDLQHCAMLYIVGAYWFTSSTSFANPAVTLARALTNTFAGIAPAHVAGFMVAQAAGAIAAVFAMRLLNREPLHSRAKGAIRPEWPVASE